MDTMEKLKLLREARAKAAQGGGEEKRKSQRSDGLTARERVLALLDEGSFVELGALISARESCTPADGVITGYGTVDGRLVYVYSQDAAVMGGAIGEMNAAKVCGVYEMAAKMGAPIVGILDSCGARIGEGVAAQAAAGKIFAAAASVSGVVPSVSLVLGNCAGSGALAAEMSDFVIINGKTGRLFVNGPTVIESSTGKKAAVDGKGCFTVSGSAHFAADSDELCLETARLLLSYLPANNLSDPAVLDCADDLNRTSPALESVDGEYDVRTVIAEVVDDGALLEVQSAYAKSAVAGFARINGSAVGVAANQPGSDGLTGQALEKLARFVRFCDCFNIPVITFTNADGFAVSAAEEEWGLARKGAKLLYAFAEATVPKVNVIVGKACGSAYAVMNSKQLGADVVYAWPQAEIAPLPSNTGVQLLYEDKLHQGASREELEKIYKETDASPLMAAAMGLVDDVIEPAETRPRIAAALEMLASKRACGPSRKHDNMPM